MDWETQAYALSLLDKALQRIGSGSCLHEGLYDAYVEDLQWLEDVDELPRDLDALLLELRNGVVRAPVGQRAPYAGQVISNMSERRIRALVDRLRATREACAEDSRPGI